MKNLPTEVANKLGYYVYVLVDPQDNQIFYVGKGCGNRLLQHGSEADLEPSRKDPAKIQRNRVISLL